jgi:hypothetical protein
LGNVALDLHRRNAAFSVGSFGSATPLSIAW